MQLSLPFDINLDITRRKHHNNPESAAAHQRIVSTKTSAHAQIITELLTSGDATCAELEIRLGLKHQTASARCSELLANGQIKRTGQRRNRSAVLTAKIK